MYAINYEYKGTQISFSNGENLMINATEMAQSFGKQPIFWLNNQSTKDYLNELSKLRNLSLADLVQVTKGGNNPGTWMHEDVALEFARWLSPAFAIWCNDRIKELLRTGVTTISNDDEVIAKAMQVLNQRLEASRIERERLEYQNTQNTEQLKISAPKVQYYDQVLQSKSTYTTTQIAKELGMSAETLNKILKEKNIQYRQSGQWVLMAKFQNKGFTSTRTHTYTSATTGETGTSMLTVWTEKGREFIRTTIKSN